MKLPESLELLITETAIRHDLPPEIVRGMVIVESGGNTRATRHEPAFKRRYIDPLKFPEKEAYARATSWGLLQIMGQTARSIGYKGPFEDLLKPENGLEWGCEYLEAIRAKYPREPWEVIVRAYNGGPGNRHNTANHYPDKVLVAMGGGEWPSDEQT